MLQHLLYAIRGVLGRAHVLLLCAPAALAAQPSRVPLTLADVVERLERANPMLAAARAATDASHARIGPATALPDPRAELGVMNRMLPGLTTMSPLAMDQLTVTQMLPLATRAMAQAARARSHAVATGVGTQRFAMRREAAIMLTDWWQADASRAVMDETRSILRESVAAAEAMYRAGQGKQTDVLRMQAELTRMTAEWMAMDAMRRSAAAGLSAMLDAPINADTLRPELPGVPASLSIDTGTAMNPDVIAAQRSVEASEAEEVVAKRERWPMLEVGLQFGRQPATNERMLGFMAGASIPIFARQRQQQMVQETAAMRRMAEADARSTVAEARAGVAEATAALDRTRALRHLYDGTLLPQLQAVRESASATYRAGTGTLEAMLDALMAENGTRIARLATQADEVRTLARLERLTGRAWLAVPINTERLP
ncbi:MAG: TolC family protein [Gemmatimonadaceae bacterium]|nr:TolC family protein [Gemmatimonadaceae bacterium]